MENTLLDVWRRPRVIVAHSTQHTMSEASASCLFTNTSHRARAGQCHTLTHTRLANSTNSTDHTHTPTLTTSTVGRCTRFRFSDYALCAVRELVAQTLPLPRGSRSMNAPRRQSAVVAADYRFCSDSHIHTNTHSSHTDRIHSYGCGRAARSRCRRRTCSVFSRVGFNVTKRLPLHTHTSRVRLSSIYIHKCACTMCGVY